jgi:three-Cys-motif partner protein
VSTPGNFQFDEIGRWSELKLEIVEKYGAAYTTAFSSESGRRLKKYYIDALSGAGVHLSKETRQQIEGSPARALRVRPPFDHFYFIDMNPEKTAYLKTLCQDRTDVDIITDECYILFNSQTSADDSIREVQSSFMLARPLWSFTLTGKL